MSADPQGIHDAPIVDAFVDAVEHFATDHINATDIDAKQRIPTALLTELAEMGLFGLSVPEEFGGLGLSLGPICEVLAALAEHDRSVATTVGLHLGLGTRGLVAFADPATQARILPGIASGEHITAFAATEPGAGSDLRGVTTKAVDNGHELVVNGQKIFVTNGGLARFYTILAATPGMGGRAKSYSLMWLDREDEGLSIGPEERKLGLKGSSTTSLHLDGLHVGRDRIIGEPGNGMEHIGHVLAWGRTAMASGCVGASRRALVQATRHVQQRVQFGKSLSRQAVVQQQLADAAAMHFAMQAMVRHTASAPDNESLERRSLATKVLCSEGNWDICDRAVQLYGGSGYIEETGLPMLLRDARITRIFEGANDVLITLIGTHEATRPTGPWSTEGPGADRAAALCARLDARRTDLTSTHKIRLLRRPRLLTQLGRLAILRQSMECAVQAAHHAHSPVATELAQHWIHQCSRLAAPHLTEPQDMALVGRIAAYCAQEILP